MVFFSELLQFNHMLFIFYCLLFILHVSLNLYSKHCWLLESRNLNKVFNKKPKS